MKITVNGTTYTEIKSLSFSPETDVTGDSVAINQFVAEIKTEDDIEIGQYAYLYDDLNNLWAKYWVIYAEHTNDYVVKLHAQSILKLLERNMLDPVMYSSEPIANILNLIFEGRGANVYALDSSFASLTVTGFCPQQSAKTRLQWLCFSINAYIKSFFGDQIEIIPVNSQSSTLIPMNKTYWKPKITYNDYVTKVNVKGYTFTVGTPTSTDKWVTDGTNHYIVTERNFSISNPNVPESAPVHEITVDGIMLVNEANVSSILSYLSTYYFKRMEVDISVINNAEYLPGERVIFCIDENTMGEGYINSCSFQFGLQAKAKMHVTPVDIKDCAALVIMYMYGDLQIGNARYLFPIDYGYSVDNPYIDILLERNRYIFRPNNASASGTMTAAGITREEEYTIALDFQMLSTGRNLRVINVDDCALDVSNGVRTLVIE